MLQADFLRLDAMPIHLEQTPFLLMRPCQMHQDAQVTIGMH